MPFWAISALAIDFAAEMPPSRTATGVGARAALSAIACASFCSVSRISQPAMAGATTPEMLMPSHTESASISALPRP